MSEVFDFAWQVWAGGYQWIKARGVPQPLGQGEEGVFLTGCTPPFTARRYAPLQEEPALFRLFLEVDPTQEGVLAFANQFGLLGDPITKEIILPNNQSGRGELLEDWRKEITLLKRTVTLWDCIQAGNVEGLARHILWNDNGVRYVSHPQRGSDTLPPDVLQDVPAFEQIAHKDEELLSRFQQGDVGQPALYYVQRVINRSLTDRVAPRLLWNRERTALGLYIVPNSLIGALWLQFAQAIAGNKAYHQCEYCGKWFEVSLEASRPTRVYCSNACRFKAYRKRQEDAYHLHSQGVSLKEIAKRLGTDTKTAKGWIKKGKEK